MSHVTTITPPAFRILRYALAIAIPLTVLLGYGAAPPAAGTPRYLSSDTWTEAARAVDDQIAPARELFFKRLDHYRARCDSLNNNIYYWVLLIGLTILILAQDPKDGFEILGVPIPTGARHMFVVVSMVYLWLEFGTTLKALIFERMALWKLIDFIEGPIAADRTVALVSLRPLLLGNGFLDGWFATFLPEYTMRSQNAGSDQAVTSAWNAAIWGVSAGMIGLAHASAYAILEDAWSLWRTNSLVRYSVPPALILIALMIAGCDLWFEFDGQGSWFFAACACAAGIGIASLPKLSSFRTAVPNALEAPTTAADRSRDAVDAKPQRRAEQDADPSDVELVRET